MGKQLSQSITEKLPIPVEMIERRIFVIRGHKVMLDRHLADLYQVKPIALRQAVKRNHKRFPLDFMFQLTKREAALLVSQNVIPSRRSLGGYLPYVFTEQGVAMLSSVLTSDRAAHVNIAIMRAFVKLRELMATHKDLAQRIEALEKQSRTTRREVGAIIKVINKMLTVHEPAIGFVVDRPKTEDKSET